MKLKYLLLFLPLFLIGCSQEEEIELVNDIEVISIKTTATTAVIQVKFGFGCKDIYASEIYYGESPDGLYQSAKGERQQTEGSEIHIDQSLTFTLTDLKPQTVYYFAIKPAEVSYNYNDVLTLENAESKRNALLVYPKDNTFETEVGYEAVDLGLSVKWCDRNVGANKVSDRGTEVYWSTVTSSLKDEAPSSNISGTKYDQAVNIMGDAWRTPTKEEWQELFDRCTFEYVNVTTVISQASQLCLKAYGPNGNFIYLPAESVEDKNGQCISIYWTANAYKASTGTCYGVTLTFTTAGTFKFDDEFLSHTCLLRAVSSK